MLLTVNALAVDVQLADTFPAEGALSIYVKAGTSGTFSVSPSQLFRLAPQLASMESRVDVTSAAPLMTWSVSSDSTEDLRAGANSGAAGIVVKSMNPGTLSVGSGNATVTLKGAGLLTGQTKAVLTVGSGAGSVLYTATVPGSAGNNVTVRHVNAGASQALAVAVVGSAITVTLATNGASVVTSTAANVVSAIAASAAAAALVIASVPSGAGTAQVAAAAHLAGGTGPGLAVTVNGAAMTLLTTSATAITFAVTAGNLTGCASGDVTRVQLTAGQQVVSLSALCGA